MNNEQNTEISKQAYQTPALVEMGKIADLTLNNATASADSATFSAP